MNIKQRRKVIEEKKKAIKDTELLLKKLKGKMNENKTK